VTWEGRPEHYAPSSHHLLYHHPGQFSMSTQYGPDPSTRLSSSNQVVIHLDDPDQASHTDQGSAPLHAQPLARRRTTDLPAPFKPMDIRLPVSVSEDNINRSKSSSLEEVKSHPHSPSRAESPKKSGFFKNKHEKVIRSYCLTYQGTNELPKTEDVIPISLHVTTDETGENGEGRQSSMNVMQQLAQMLPHHLSPHNPLSPLTGELLFDYCYDPEIQKSMKESVTNDLRLLQSVALAAAENAECAIQSQAQNPAQQVQSPATRHGRKLEQAIPEMAVLDPQTPSLTDPSKPSHSNRDAIPTRSEGDSETPLSFLRRLTATPLSERFHSPPIATNSIGDRSDVPEQEIELARLGLATTTFADDLETGSRHSLVPEVPAAPIPAPPSANTADTDVIALYNRYMAGQSQTRDTVIIDTSTDAPKMEGCYGRCRVVAHNIILNPYINWFYVLLLFIQIAILCIAIEAASTNRKEEAWVTATDGTVVAIFLLEVCIRLVAVGMRYFTVLVNVLDLIMLLFILVLWSLELAYPNSIGPWRTAVLVARFLGRALRLLLIARHWAQVRRMISAADAGIDLEGYENRQNQVTTVTINTVSQIAAENIRMAAAEDEVQQAIEDREEAQAQRHQVVAMSASVLAATGELPRGHQSAARLTRSRTLSQAHELTEVVTVPNQESASHGPLLTTHNEDMHVDSTAGLGWRVAGTRPSIGQLSDIEESRLSTPSSTVSSTESEQDEWEEEFPPALPGAVAEPMAIVISPADHLPKDCNILRGHDSEPLPQVGGSDILDEHEVEDTVILPEIHRLPSLDIAPEHDLRMPETMSTHAPHRSVRAIKSYIFFGSKTVSFTEALRTNPILTLVNRAWHTFNNDGVTHSHSTDLSAHRTLAHTRLVFAHVRDHVLFMQRGFNLLEQGDVNFIEDPVLQLHEDLGMLSHRPPERQLLTTYVKVLGSFLRPRLALWPALAAKSALHRMLSTPDLCASHGRTASETLKPRLERESHRRTPSSARRNSIDLRTGASALEQWYSQLSTAAEEGDGWLQVDESSTGYSRLVASSQQQHRHRTLSAQELWYEAELALVSTGRAWLYSMETFAVRQDMCERGQVRLAIALARAASLLGCNSGFAVPTSHHQQTTRVKRTKTFGSRAEAIPYPSDADTPVIGRSPIASFATPRGSVLPPLSLGPSNNQLLEESGDSPPLLAPDECSAAGELRGNLLTHWLVVWGSPSATSVSALVSTAALFPTSVSTTAAALSLLSAVPHLLSRLKLRRTFKAFMESIEQRVTHSIQKHDHHLPVYSCLASTRPHGSKRVSFSEQPSADLTIEHESHVTTEWSGAHPPDADQREKAIATRYPTFLRRIARTHSLHDTREPFAFSPESRRVMSVFTSTRQDSTTIDLDPNRTDESAQSSRTRGKVNIVKGLVLNTEGSPSLAQPLEDKSQQTAQTPHLASGLVFNEGTNELSPLARITTTLATQAVTLAHSYLTAVQRDVEASDQASFLAEALHHVDARGIHIRRVITEKKSASPTHAGSLTALRQQRSRTQVETSIPGTDAESGNVSIGVFDHAATVPSAPTPGPYPGSEFQIRRGASTLSVPLRTNTAMSIDATSIVSDPEDRDSLILPTLRRTRGSFLASPTDVAVLQQVMPAGSDASPVAAPSLTIVGALASLSEQAPLRIPSSTQGILYSPTPRSHKGQPVGSSDEVANHSGVFETNDPSLSYLPFKLPTSGASGTGDAAPRKHVASPASPTARSQSSSTSASSANVIRTVTQDRTDPDDLVIANKRLAEQATRDAFLQSYVETLRPSAALAVAKDLLTARTRQLNALVAFEHELDRHSLQLREAHPKHTYDLEKDVTTECVTRLQQKLQTEIEAVCSKLVHPIAIAVGVTAASPSASVSLMGMCQSPPSRDAASQVIETSALFTQTEHASILPETRKYIRTCGLKPPLVTSPAARSACLHSNLWLPAVSVKGFDVHNIWILRRLGHVGYGHGIVPTNEFSLVPGEWALHATAKLASKSTPSLTLMASPHPAHRPTPPSWRTSALSPSESQDLVVYDPLESTWQDYQERTKKQYSARRAALQIAGYDASALDQYGAELALLRFARLELVSTLIHEQEIRLSNFYHRESEKATGDLRDSSGFSGLTAATASSLHSTTGGRPEALAAVGKSKHAHDADKSLRIPEHQGMPVAMQPHHQPHFNDHTNIVTMSAMHDQQVKAVMAYLPSMYLGPPVPPPALRVTCSDPVEV